MSNQMPIDGSMWITAESIDPIYNRPVIDSRADLKEPVRHHKVSGHFENTDKRFNFYFPLKSQWEGRFFQHVYPQYDENATDETVSFGADSGAYTIQTNGGGGYRVDAAAAKFSKTIAASYYESSDRIYGYIYGGSGGSYQTIGAIENSSGVWDGAVPYIPGVPISIPNNFFVRAFARFVLENKAKLIADSMSPGGSNNPYTGLNDMERAVLLEVTKMGVPIRGWEDYEYTLGLNDPQGLLGFGNVVREIDPAYVDDFWSKPGYLAMEQSPLGELIRSIKIDQFAIISKISRDNQNIPTSMILDGLSKIPTTTGYDFTLYAPDGETKIGTLSGSLDSTGTMFIISSGNPDSVIGAIENGAKLHIDNRWSLALLSYHRHQAPKRADYYGWDQLRGADGTPLFPQRTVEVGPAITSSVAGGGTYSGLINGKVIMVANLLDVDAYPWHADWYCTQVKKSVGESFDDQFRIWFNDHADHIDNGPRTVRLVQYDTILKQALRDVSAWAEKDVAPARSTPYEVIEGQVRVPEKAIERQGIQPIIDLNVNNAAVIHVAGGETVTFAAKIQVPPGAGKVVDTDWDFDGTGNFTSRPYGSPSETVEVSVTHTYTTPGTYFPSLRASSQREGDKSTPFTKVQNLGRVRVVVY